MLTGVVSHASMEKRRALQELIDELDSLHQQQIFMYDTAHKLLSEAGSIHHLAMAQRDRMVRLDRDIRSHLQRICGDTESHEAGSTGEEELFG